MNAASPILLKPANRLHEINLAEDQPEYLALPVLLSAGREGICTSRFKLSWRERFHVLFSGNIWLQQSTFHVGYHPIKLLASEPPVEECL